MEGQSHWVFVFVSFIESLEQIFVAGIWDVWICVGGV